jgi:hypothetical protein
MAALGKPGKTNSRFSPVCPTPWKSGKQHRISTFPPPPRLLTPANQKTKKTKGNRPLRGLHIRIYFRITLHWKR